MRSVSMVSEFCAELSALVRNDGLRKYHEGAESGTHSEPEKWHWPRHDKGQWGFDKTPPYLPGVFYENAATEMRKQ